jgi:hypothetical protein
MLDADGTIAANKEFFFCSRLFTTPNSTNVDSFKINKDWSHRSSKDFWGEIAPSEHVVQIYENDKVFLDLLHGFVSDGFDSGDCVVVIATPAHLQALAKRLAASGFNLQDLETRKIYFPLEAEMMLSKFMINEWPDETLFNQVITDLMSKAKADVRPFRAFGEMVALLWAKGHIGATVRLEHLWNKFCASQTLCLFCAYPQSGFIQETGESVAHICQAHSKMIAGVSQSQTEVFYKTVEKQLG